MKTRLLISTLVLPFISFSTTSYSQETATEYNLYNPKGEIVHTHLNCKDGYKLFLETLPDNLLN